MTIAVTDDVIRMFVTSPKCREPVVLGENDGAWYLGTLSISKHRPGYSDGWGHDLRPDSRFYKRWFDFPDLGKRGWAIIFRVFEPTGDVAQKYEYFPGWVEREAEADEWIAFLNDQIQARLREAATSRRSRG